MLSPIRSPAWSSWWASHLFFAGQRPCSTVALVAATNERSQACSALPASAAATSAAASKSASMKTASNAAVARATANPGSASTACLTIATSPDRRAW